MTVLERQRRLSLVLTREKGDANDRREIPRVSFGFMT